MSNLSSSCPRASSRAPSRTVLLEAHYRLQAEMFISRSEKSGGWLTVFSNTSAAPMWNHAALLDALDADFPSSLDRVVKAWPRADRRPTIYLANVPATADSTSTCSPVPGWAPCDQESWMWFDTADVLPVKAAEGLSIAEARTATQLEDFVTVFCAAYQTEFEPYRDLFTRLQPPRGDCRAVHFVAYKQGRAASIATLMVVDGLGCIYNVGTLPAMRRQGIGEHLVRTLLARPDCPGGIFLQAQTGSGAERLYSRLGFQTLFSRTGYHWRHWRESAGSSHRQLGRPSAEEALAAMYRDGPMTGEGDGGQRRIPISAEIVCASKSTAAAYEIQRETVWTGAWAILLSRYSQSESVGFGVQLPGALNSASVRLAVPDEDKVGPWLRRIQVGLAQKSEFSGKTSADADIVLRFGVAPAARRCVLEVRLDLGVKPHGEVQFDPEKLDANVVERLVEQLTAVVLQLRSGPATLGSVDLLTEAERRSLLQQGGTTPGRFMPAATVGALLNAAAEAHASRTAVILANGDTRTPAQLTYAELARRASALAARLQGLGVGPERRVAVCLERSLEMVVALLGILRAGGVCVPLDPAWPAERLQLVVQDAEADVLVTQGALAETLGDLPTRVLRLDELDGIPAAEACVWSEPFIEGRHAAYIIYTSGSTGKPKGVVIPQEAIANHCLEAVENYALTERDRVLQFNSLAFDAAFEQILATLTAGATLVLRGPEHWPAVELSRAIDQFQLTVLDLPTAYWHQAMSDWRSGRARLPERPPRLLIVGGEEMRPESVELWRALPFQNCRLINAYGPTETTITATAFEVSAGFLAGPLPRRIPIGRPRGSRTAYVLDSKQRLVPRGVPGELCLGGPLLAREYWKRPELTLERFIPNPFGALGERLYRTGDLVRLLEDGNLEFLGRVDQQVKIRGFRVELGEIESALCSHPGVKAAAVTLREVEAARSVLIAFVVATDAQPLPEGEVRRFLRHRLPDYMVPSRLVKLEDLPVLPSGKIDRRRLAQMELPDLRVAEIPARTPEELRVQLIFERVLRRPGVGIDQSFFELGGDSLQALELIVELGRVAGCELPLDVLYRNPTVEGLAKCLARPDSEQATSSLVPLQAGGSRPPLFLVHTTPGDILGYGNLIYHLDTEQPCYGLQSVGLIRPEERHRRIEEMAGAYVGLIRSMMPEGPYYLAGWCYGGLVAVEMAHYLLALGEKVAFLGLFETVAPAPGLRCLRYYGHRAVCLFRMSPQSWWCYLRSKLKYYRDVRVANRMRFRRVETQAAESGPGLAEHNRRLELLELIYNTNLEALRFYRPKPYPGRVTLFNARETDPGVIRDPLYGWPGLAAEIEVHAVPGDHDSMLTEPNVEALAGTFEACLRRAQAQAQPAQPTGRGKSALSMSHA